MLMTLKTLRAPALLAVAGLLTACANGALLGDERTELGDFRLCYNIVTLNDAVQGPLSREADLDVFADNIRSEIDRRFGRYDGDRLYHIAIHLDAYVLAVPGIPLVASPRSALIISVNLWDDQLGRPLNEEPQQFSVLESMTGENVLGSGLTQTAEEQMQVLSANAAIRIENWMSEHPEWFDHGSGEPADDAVAASDEGPAAASDSTEAAAEPAADVTVDTTDAASPDANVETASAADPSASPADAGGEDRCAYDSQGSQALVTE